MPNISKTSFALIAAFFAFSTLAHAQDAAPSAQETSAAEAKMLATRHRDTSLDPIRTYHLQAGSGANYANEILTGLRQMLDPSCRMYLVPEQNTMLVRCNAEQLVIADHIMHETDTPKANYRLTYTVVESDSGKRIGVQHFALTMIPSVRTTLKDGSKIPVATGSYSAGASVGAAQAGVQTQFTYLDIGLNFDATLNPGADGLRLQSKVEQSSTGEDRTISGVTEPIVRQAVLEGSATLQVGKPLMLGTLDVAASTRHLDVEVLLELVK